MVRRIAPSFGHTADQTRPAELLTGCGVDTGTSATGKCDASSAAIEHLVLEAVCDAAGDDGELRRVEAPRARQIDFHLMAHPTRPAPENHHPGPQPAGPAPIV